MGTIHCTRKELQKGIAIPLDERTKLVVGPDAARGTVVGRIFDAGKCFPLPRSLPAFEELFAFCAGTPAKAALVVGHANKGGDDAEVETLTQERAAIGAAWLLGEVDPWLAQYEDGVEEAKRWGRREDHLMLAQFDDFPKVEARESAPSPNQGGQQKPRDPLVESYQASRGLSADGIAGPITRRKLIEEYFGLTRRSRLAKGGAADETSADSSTIPEPAKLDFEVDAHGAGAHFPVVDDAVAELEESVVPPPSERLDFFLFPGSGGIEPAPGATGGPEYTEWRELAELHRDFGVGAGKDGAKIVLALSDKTGLVKHRARKFKLTGPEEFEGTTDADGRIVIHDVPVGDYELTLELKFLEPPHEVTDVYTAKVVVLATQADVQEVRRIGVVPRCVMASLPGMLFDTNKAFLLPTALAGLSTIQQFYEANNPSKLLVVGHTDTTSDASINDPLSLERAESVLAYLKNDEAAWLELYGSKVPTTRRWGEVEDVHMISALPDFTPAAAADPIGFYRRTRELAPGDEADTAMRERLIAEYMALDRADLTRFAIEGFAHGCGENFPVDDAGEQLEAAAPDKKEDQLDRRVELFFFDTEFGVFPAPKGKHSKRGSTEYPMWRKQSLRQSAEDLAGQPLRLRIHLLGEDGAALPTGNVTFKVEQDGIVIAEGTTIDGQVKVAIERDSEPLLCVFWQHESEAEEHMRWFNVECIEDAEKRSTVIARLQNLGYRLLEDTSLAFEEINRLFQQDQNLAEDPVVGDEAPRNVIDRLKEIFETAFDAQPAPGDAEEEPEEEVLELSESEEFLCEVDDEGVIASEGDAPADEVAEGGESDPDELDDDLIERDPPEPDEEVA